MNGGALVWAIGAAAAWALLRDWPQAALLAVLVPLWLIGKWERVTRGQGAPYIPAAGCAMLAFTDLSARSDAAAGPVRLALVWIGGIGLIPAVIFTCILGHERFSQLAAGPEHWIAWSIAIALPLGLAWILRGPGAIRNAGAIAWVLLLVAIASQRESDCCTCGSPPVPSADSVGIVERRAERSTWASRDSRSPCSGSTSPT